MSAPPYPKIYNRYVRREDDTVDLDILKRPEFGLVKNWLVTEKIDGTNIRVSLEPDPGWVPNIERAPAPADLWVVEFGGRTNRAQMPDFIQEYLESLFVIDAMKNLWQCRRNCTLCAGRGKLPVIEPGAAFTEVSVVDEMPCPNREPYPIVLYGEVYGAGVQKGGEYRRDGDISFRLFDVLVAERSWLGWDSVVDVASKLAINTVPVMHAIMPYAPNNCMDANAIISLVRTGFTSVVAHEEGTPRLAEGIVARTDPYLFDGNKRRVVWKLKTKDL